MGLGIKVTRGPVPVKDKLQIASLPHFIHNRSFFNTLTSDTQKRDEKSFSQEALEEVLITSETIQSRVRELGEEITMDYDGLAEPLVLIGILKGCLVFLADLSRRIALPVEMELMSVSSYGPSTRSSGAVRILKDLDTSITDRDVLLVEGIIDTGLTLSYLLRTLEARKPRSLNVCTLLDKASRRSLEIPIGYCGFTIPDKFVVGYGLDYAQKFRNLEFIGTLKPEVYEGEG